MTDEYKSDLEPEKEPRTGLTRNDLIGVGMLLAFIMGMTFLFLSFFAG